MKKTKRLTEDDIKDLAKLANLRLSAEEIEIYSQQLSSILDYVAELQKIDTAKVEATASTTGLTNVIREDKAANAQSLLSLKDLKIAKKGEKKFFVVKRIL